MTSAPITAADLITPFSAGEKPEGSWLIGTEHEKFVFRIDDHRAPSYDEPGGIRDLLAALEPYGWAPVEEGGQVIALSGPDGAVSLEPAGQFELSGAPRADLHQTLAETRRHIDQVRVAGAALGLGFLGMGMWPDKARDELPWMPKARYAIMRRHMPRVGTLGLDMMQRTATIQTNLDYADEADMVAKFRVSLALQPVATALFAASPFTDGAPNGYRSYRSHIWTDTDAARTGMLPFVFDEGFGYEAYARYMRGVPMYFVRRDGGYIDAAGLSFDDFLDGRLPVLPGQRPTATDWIDHLSTAFPEVRLKSYLEMRGADGGPVDRIVALPALWVGLLYDPGTLARAADLIADWTIAQQQAMRDAVPRLALAAPAPGGGTVRDLAREVLALARQGLVARGRLDSHGRDESCYLDPLDAMVADGMTLADRMLAAWEGPWARDMDRLYEAMRL